MWLLSIYYLRRNKYKVIFITWSCNSAYIHSDSRCWPEDFAIHQETSISKAAEHCMPWVTPVGLGQGLYHKCIFASLLCFKNEFLVCYDNINSLAKGLIPTTGLSLNGPISTLKGRHPANRRKGSFPYSHNILLIHKSETKTTLFPEIIEIIG